MPRRLPPGLFKRGDIFYVRVKIDGRWVSKTLNTADLVTAKIKLADHERQAANASYRAANETSFATAIDEFMISRTVKGCAAGTMHMYGVKTAHLLRVFGDIPLARVDAPKVDRYIALRLQEGAARNTISKELTALRGILKIAKRAKKFSEDLAAVMPVDFSPEYEPRKTALTPIQVGMLLEELRFDRAAFVAFVVGTGARLGEARRARREDIDMARGIVHFKITKTRKSGKAEKFVPVTSLTKPLLERVLAATAEESASRGPGELLFEPWGNVIRDLRIACQAAGVPVITPNDLRRTHANWLREAGVDTSTIAEVLGHMDGRMCERVYGRLKPEQLRDRVVSVVASSEVH